MLKLPKAILNHPKAAELEAYFRSNLAPLRPDGDLQVTRWTWDAKLAACLRTAAGTRHLMQGLEAIAAKLDQEGRGLQLAQAKSGKPASPRLSRLLLLANDGAPRFYRDAEALLRRHQDRLGCVVIDADAKTLGELKGASGKAVRALLIDDKDALAMALTVLANEL